MKHSPSPQFPQRGSQRGPPADHQRQERTHTDSKSDSHQPRGWCALYRKTDAIMEKIPPKGADVFDTPGLIVEKHLAHLLTAAEQYAITSTKTLTKNIQPLKRTRHKPFVCV